MLRSEQVVKRRRQVCGASEERVEESEFRRLQQLPRYPGVRAQPFDKVDIAWDPGRRSCHGVAQ
ncbi:hypothetical protein GCM10028801_45400 [Nocardioides maradonensis]